MFRTGAANDILAQVGTLIKSDRKDNLLSGVAVRKMILTGSSASAAVAQNYLTNAHMAQRLAGMKPIYDGFMPTSANMVRFRLWMYRRFWCPLCRKRSQATGPRSRIMKSSVFTNLPGWRISIRAWPAVIIPIRARYPISRYPMGAGDVGGTRQAVCVEWTRALRSRTPIGSTSISIRITSRSSTATGALSSRWMNSEM